MLSVTVIQLVQFQEDAFGKNVTKPPLTRLPMKCFMDFRPNGGLCQILAVVYKWVTMRNVIIYCEFFKYKYHIADFALRMVGGVLISLHLPELIGTLR